jgi:hypothetical protein
MNDQAATPLLPSANNVDSSAYIDEDSQKSMAIVNLQAILSDSHVDIDRIITLLEENNWDINLAANAFYT